MADPQEEPATGAPAGYETRTYALDALPAILSLLQQTLGDSGAVRKTEDFWRWKHHASPFGQSYGLYAWDDTNEDSSARLAALRVLMRWIFCTPSGEQIRGVRAVDTATHPSHQRRGLFSRLTRQAIEELSADGVDFIFNTPNANSLPGYLKMGWQVTARWPLYLKLLRPLRMAYRHLRSVAAESAGDFDSQFGAGILTWEDFSQRFEDQSGELIAMWENRRRQTGLRTLRTREYFVWRYGGHPHVRYGVYPYTNPQGELQGFAILRPNGRYGWQETVLTELILMAPHTKLGIELVRSLCRHLKSDYVIAHFAQNTLEFETLYGSNFWRIPRQHIVFTVRPLQTSAMQYSRMDAWDLTLGDLELF